MTTRETRPSKEDASAGTMAGESPGYLSCRSESIYYVLHRPAAEPRAVVLLTGPLPDERTHSHLTWVRWARILSERGFMVMRFDYSGTGESTGSFEDATLSSWTAELISCADHLGNEAPGRPLIINGLRLGGLIASTAFVDGCGDGLLTFEPMTSGRALLSDAARRQQAANMVQGIAGEAPGPRALASRLERGLFADVNGYRWSPGLWASARGRYLEEPAPEDTRPLLHLRLVRASPTNATSTTGRTGAGRTEAVRISWPPFWMVGHRLIHETDELFARALRFIEEEVRPAALEASS